MSATAEINETKVKIEANIETTIQKPSGKKWERIHTQPNQDIYGMTKWEHRTAIITDEHGKIIFEQKDVEVPVGWSDLALNIVASKYFSGVPGTPAREKSIRSLIFRVVSSIIEWGKEDDYFSSDEDAKNFQDELTYLLLFQHASFNSPVWFNVGNEKRPQCSACFINSVEDSMESILELAKTEGMLFKHGSGTGSNLSSLRSSKEILSGGGTASGPISFMRGFDAFAGAIKSGGKTRRAAKMVILNADHPDIKEFVECKVKEEAKAYALVDAGYDASLNGEAYSSVFFQNANHSVRVSDQFMEAFLHEKDWSTRAVRDGKIMETFPAAELMDIIGQAAHTCGDPGIQFDDAINRWHTCKATDRINGSNPCSEYMFLDDTACNLASINLIKYLKGDEFDTNGFRHACEVMITAQEILVDRASYPTEKIARNSFRFRPLGLGFANLGSLLLKQGIPYDSPEAHGWAGAITALMTGTAFLQSARISSMKGPFEGYQENRESMLDVMRMHRDAVEQIQVQNELPARRKSILKNMINEARDTWNETVLMGTNHGYRNAQASVLAPTGTIAFMMDCDTTGIEPDIALIKYKRLSGGGILKIVNRGLKPALEKLGYKKDEIDLLCAYVDKNETIEGAPGLKEEHLPVFDCAFRPKSGKRSISPMGHVRMMAAAQPFLSGAISKTVNMPEDASIKDIINIYVASWKLGLKALAIYRDGCKQSQPLSTSMDSNKKAKKDPKARDNKPFRRRLPVERSAITHHFSIQGQEGYITVGMYDDETPGEIFFKMSKEGSTISGLMDTVATLASMSLQYGVPLQALVKKFSHVRFEPSGFTNNPEIPMAKSIIDYSFRWLASRFLSKEERKAVGVLDAKEFIGSNTTQLNLFSGKKKAEEIKISTPKNGEKKEVFTFQNQVDAPACSVCGSITVRNASCYLCPSCGTSNGCS